MRIRMLPRFAVLVAMSPAAVLACAGMDPTVPAAEAAAFERSAHSAAAAGPAASAAGVRVVRFPEEDPGPPLYARVTPLLNQIFVADGMVAIPFYRDPACVPLDTDLLEHIHPPGEHGPGSFACPLLVSGFYTVERDAPLGTFPLRAVVSGPAQVWFVPQSEFDAAASGGVLTMAELMALAPLRGTASTFNEMLAPRLENHHLVITSRGTLADGRTFQFNVNHRGDITQSIQLRIR
jgi:hypothetical protein